MMFQTLARTMHPHDTLRIACEGCGRSAGWTRTEAFQRLGPDATPADIRWRLRCDGCGEKGKARVWI